MACQFVERSAGPGDLASVVVWKKGVPGGMADLLKLPDSFGAAEDAYKEYTIETIPDAMAASQSVIEFCALKGVDRRTAWMTGLCTEEIACNILQYGASDGRKHFVSVRVICKGELTLGIQDDCVKFDPRERMNAYAPDSPEKNVGLRMVAGIAKKTDYYNIAGINTLIIKM